MEEDELFYGEEDPYEHLGEKIKLIFKWYPIDELEKLELYPVFLREKLSSLPEGTEHIISF